jgi:MoaA/NifB/PqqE/SkfB family radical SAM enzyme
MIEILPQIPQYKLFRSLGAPKKKPLNITVSVTYRCNSRCKTCNVWKRQAEELSLDEYESIFRSLGKTPFWFTISGGEPFLRTDLPDICQSIYRNCKPGVINIATNGILSERIPEVAKRIIEACPDSNVVINLSLDGIGPKHDEIRNVPGNWEKALKTYRALREFEYDNFELGIHSVISKFNVEAIPEVSEYMLRELKPDSYITEIAEQRVELGTIGEDITPPVDAYCKTIDYLLDEIKKQRFSGLSKITQAFRVEYYGLVKKVLQEKRQILPCYAGFASAHIAPDGDVWTCCIRADPIGNLRETGYDFQKVWLSSKAAELRKSVKNRECYCPLANASYTNMLCHIPTLAKVAWRSAR